MNKRLFIFTVLCAFTMLGSRLLAQSGSVISFETTLIDYGIIDKGSDGIRNFKFTNTGTEPLVITSAKGSCGCTVPTYPKEPIMPGGSSSIGVTYDTQRIGAFTKTITLSTNCVNDMVVLTIKGEVKEITEIKAQ